jgi:hypothetical protein
MILLTAVLLGSAGVATAEAQRLRLPVQVARFKAIKMTASFAKRMDAKSYRTGKCRRDTPYKMHCGLLVENMPRGNYCAATAVVRMDRRNRVSGKLRDVSCG